MAKKSSLICPFSGLQVEIRELSEATVWVESPYGWKSKVLGSLAAGRQFLKKIDVDDVTIKTLTAENSIRFRVVGDGWFSKPFQTEVEARFWASMRGGEMPSTAPDPTPVTETPSDEAPEGNEPFSVKDVVEAAEAGLDAEAATA
jgi:hypothetical protein